MCIILGEKNNLGQITNKLPSHLTEQVAALAMS